MSDEFDPTTLTDRELYELADGMRHWWNDDNAEDEQVEAYEALQVFGQVVNDLEGLDPPTVKWIEKWEKYVMDLEACVAEMYCRFET